MEKKKEPTVGRGWTETTAQVHLPSVSAQLFKEETTERSEGSQVWPYDIVFLSQGGRAVKSTKKKRKEGVEKKLKEKKEKEREREGRESRRHGQGVKTPPTVWFNLWGFSSVESPSVWSWCWWVVTDPAGGDPCAAQTPRVTLSGFRQGLRQRTESMIFFFWSSYCDKGFTVEAVKTVRKKKKNWTWCKIPHDHRMWTVLWEDCNAYDSEPRHEGRLHWTGWSDKCHDIVWHITHFLTFTQRRWSQRLESVTVCEFSEKHWHKSSLLYRI